MKNNPIAHILVPLDFSESSLNALETAIAIAKQHNATITLLNVVDPSFMFGFKGVYYIAEKTIDSIVEVSDRRLSLLAKKVKEEHALNCTSEVKVGPVPQSIIKTAFDIDADIIIMGTHVSKLFNHCKTIIRANVILRKIEKGTLENKQCEIRLMIPGYDHFVRENTDVYKKSVSQAVEVLQKILRRRKNRIIAKRYSSSFLAVDKTSQ